MKSSAIYIAAAMVCCTFWSCKTSKILEATFEGDAIGSAPTKNLPGDPSGDAIEFAASLAPKLKVQNSPIAGAKALHFTNIDAGDIPATERWLTFKGIGTDLTETVWFTHTGQNVSPVDNMYIYVSDGHAHLIAMMIIRSNGEVALSNTLGDDFPHVLGDIGTGVHTIVFTTMASSLKYNVTVIRDNGPALTAENRPMITTNALSFNNPAHPMISFQHSGLSDFQHTYAIGSVSISRKKP